MNGTKKRLRLATNASKRQRKLWAAYWGQEEIIAFAEPSQYWSHMWTVYFDGMPEEAINRVAAACVKAEPGLRSHEESVRLLRIYGVAIGQQWLVIEDIQEEGGAL